MPGKRAGDVLAEAIDARDVAERPAFRILNREHVEREAIGGGERLCVHDGAARNRYGAGELREQAGMIGRVDRDVGDGTEGVAFGGKGEQLAFRIRVRHQAGVAFVFSIVEGEPIGIVVP